MKMIMAIVGKGDVKDVKKAMMREGFSITQLSSFGGFLRTAECTLISVVRNERVDLALDILRKTAKSKTYRFSDVPVENRAYASPDLISQREMTVGGGVIFVLNVEDVHRL